MPQDDRVMVLPLQNSRLDRSVFTEANMPHFKDVLNFMTLECCPEIHIQTVFMNM